MKNRIKDLLAEKNMTALELSAMVGISRVSLSNIINDKQEASANTLNIIAEKLSVPFWQLFVSPVEVTEDANTIICPHCGGKIHFDEEPRIRP